MIGRRVAVAVALAIALAACGGAAAPKCELAPAPTPTGPPFLWKVDRAGAATVWLFGTLHVGATESVPAAAWTALAASPRLVSELGDLEPDPDRLREVTTLPRGQSLPQLLGSDDWYELRDALRGKVGEDELKRYRPWYAMSRLSVFTAPPPRPTMDDAITERAKAAHLPIDHLETWEDQLGSLVDAVNIDDLREAIHARSTMQCGHASMRASYEAGDEPAMTASLAARDAEHLLLARNRRWLPQLEALAASGGGFVAVGLGHMLGEGGLPTLLVAAGYTVERVR